MIRIIYRTSSTANRQLLIGSRLNLRFDLIGYGWGIKPNPLLSHIQISAQGKYLAIFRMAGLEGEFLDYQDFGTGMDMRIPVKECGGLTGPRELMREAVRYKLSASSVWLDKYPVPPR